MPVTIKAKVSSKIDNAVGQSQVRFSAEIDIGDGKARIAELIISTAEPEVLDAFKRGEEVKFVEG